MATTYTTVVLGIRMVVVLAVIGQIIKTAIELDKRKEKVKDKND